MSAAQSPEQRPFPYQTRNLTEPSPCQFDDAPTNRFDERKLEIELERRRADIAKAMAQEALRWEAGSVEREMRRQHLSQHIADVLPFAR